MTRTKYLRQQAWDYFALHARQRLTTVHFFLIVATTLAAMAAASLDAKSTLSGLALPSGLLLLLLSFAFWRLDRRNRDLIRSAEAALRSFEASDSTTNTAQAIPPTLLFTREYYESKKRKEAVSWRRYLIPHTYSHVFNALFAGFGATGLLITLLALR